MRSEDVEALVAGAVQTYHAPGELIVGPASGVVDYLYYVRSGSVIHRPATGQSADFQFEAGDVFPLGAMMARRAVTGTHTANADTFCLRIGSELLREVAERSPPLSDYLNRSILTLLEESQRLLFESQASQALSGQSLESRLGDLTRGEAVSVTPDVPVEHALRLMHARRLGSVPVVGQDGEVLGILTRYDVLGRIALPRLPLDTPIRAVMTSPVRTLTSDDAAVDAALLMSQHGVRHVPVTEGGRLVGIVSERDLFAIQRLSLKQFGTGIQGARDLASLKAAAADLRRFAGALLGQGVQARQLTRIISRLNDALTVRLVKLVAERHAIDLGRGCWLAAGSEGREEQTIATDQDNGLAFQSDSPATDRPGWLAFARDANQALDECGFPLCRGNVMASNPRWCLTPQEWRDQFAAWIGRGEPQDLLEASAWLDFRPLAGNLDLATSFRPLVRETIVRHPRFLRLLAESMLERRAPLDWLGGIGTTDRDGRSMLDIKLNGTMIYVDAARLYALAHDVDAVGTRARLQGAGHRMGVPAREAEGWVGGFEYLQMLRLRGQIQERSTPNLIDVDALNDIDRRVLKESLRIARRLQQRVEMDFLR
jgi:CBS domain-containing protein